MEVELVTSLKRHATRTVSELHASQHPILITEQGQPSAYLVDIEGYEFQQRRMRILEGIGRGDRDIQEGVTSPWSDRVG